MANSRDLEAVLSSGTEISRVYPSKRIYRPELICSLNFSTRLREIIDCAPIFEASNEPYIEWKKINKMLSSDHRLERALLICGGGDQGIYILSLLEKNNDLQRVEFVDQNMQQLLHLVKIVSFYNNTPDGGNYMSVISGREYAKRPMRYKTKLYLYKTDLLDRVKKVSGGTGSYRYFIYLSNAPNLYTRSTFWMNYERSQTLFRKIAGDEHFKDGTLVLFMNSVTEPHLLEKTDGMLKEIASKTSKSIRRHVLFSEGEYKMSDSM